MFHLMQSYSKDNYKIHIYLQTYIKDNHTKQFNFHLSNMFHRHNNQNNYIHNINHSNYIHQINNYIKNHNKVLNIHYIYYHLYQCMQYLHTYFLLH